MHKNRKLHLAELLLLDSINKYVSIVKRVHLSTTEIEKSVDTTEEEAEEDGEAEGGKSCANTNSRFKILLHLLQWNINLLLLQFIEIIQEEEKLNAEMWI